MDSLARYEKFKNIILIRYIIALKPMMLYVTLFEINWKWRNFNTKWAKMSNRISEITTPIHFLYGLSFPSHIYTLKSISSMHHIRATPVNNQYCFWFLGIRLYEVPFQIQHNEKRIPIFARLNKNKFSFQLHIPIIVF